MYECACFLIFVLKEVNGRRLRGEKLYTIYIIYITTIYNCNPCPGVLQNS